MTHLHLSFSSWCALCEGCTSRIFAMCHFSMCFLLPRVQQHCAFARLHLLLHFHHEYRGISGYRLSCRARGERSSFIRMPYARLISDLNKKTRHLPGHPYRRSCEGSKALISQDLYVNAGRRHQGPILLLRATLSLSQGQLHDSCVSKQVFWAIYCMSKFSWRKNAWPYHTLCPLCHQR